MKNMIVMLCVLLGVGCASTSQNVPQLSGVISAPINGKARILVYRQSQLTGTAVGFDLESDGEKIGGSGQEG